jgi:hypothetical protein
MPALGGIFCFASFSNHLKPIARPSNLSQISPVKGCLKFSFDIVTDNADFIQLALLNLDTMSSAITNIPNHDEIEISTYDPDADNCDVDSLASETTSITDSVLDYVYENGRRYHSQRWASGNKGTIGGSILPNDATEQKRLDLIHHFYLLALRGELYLAPLKEGKVRNALDLGTGTGIHTPPSQSVF